MRLSELAEFLHADLKMPDGAGEAKDVVINGVAPIYAAEEGQVTFLTTDDYAKHLASTEAAAVITAKPRDECVRPQLIHRNPYWAFAKTAQMFHRPARGPVGISDEAFIAEDAEVGEDVTVYPYAYIGSKAHIGNGVILMPGVFVGDGAEIGDGCILHPNVTVEGCVKLGERVIVHGGTVLGSDGFGFAPGEGEICKIPQVGGVEIGDDVEIGANCSVDRGAMANTTIGNGTKVDSHVHVGHNVSVGEHSMLCGMSGLAGSAKVGNWSVIAGHSGVNNRCEVGDHVQVGAMTAVTKNLSEPGQYIGFPATSARDWRRQQAHQRRLPQLEKRVKELEAKLDALARRGGEKGPS